MRPLLALLAALLAEIQDDDAAKRELADVLRQLTDALGPYLVSAQDHERADRLLNVTEKAIELGLHADTLRKMAADNRIWAKKVGREWRFRPGDLPQSQPRASQGAVAVGAPKRRSQHLPSVAAIRGR